MGTNGQNGLGTNLTFTKFLFILAYRDDAATLLKIRNAGSNISRGFFNDYDADGTRDPQPQETIQFLQADGPSEGRQGIGAARHVIHLSANYRPRLDEVVTDLKRRIDGSADLIELNGAERAARYTSAEMHNYAYKPALSRLSGRNPDGYQRPNEFDFITYFECTDENIPVFDQICRALRDERQNPEWKYVLEGPEWRGKRVLRW